MQFFIDHSMYAALVVAVITMVGVLIYLWRLDARIRRVERDVDVLEGTAAAPDFRQTLS